MRHIGPPLSPRQYPFRAPGAAFGQRLQARDLQDLALRVVAKARIGYGYVIERDDGDLIRNA